MRSGGAACHSLVRPVSHPGAVLETVPAVLKCRPVPGFTRVWTVTTGDRADGDRARRLRETELSRPLGDGSTLRCLLLSHLDGHELVLVADRGQVPVCCLELLADLATTVPDDAGERWRSHLGSGAHRRSGPSGGANLVAAAAEVCAAVLHSETVTARLEELDALPTGFLVSADGTLSALPEPPEDPYVTVIVTTVAPQEYRPVLAPWCPVTVVAVRQGDATFDVAVEIDLTRVDPVVADVLRAQIPRRVTSGSGPFALRRSEADEIRRAGRGADLAGELAAGVPAAFAAIASAHAGRVAVTGEDGSLTYAELDEASRSAASFLVARGIRPGERVGICVERSARAVVALLAIFRAGGCYVPMDPSHPPARRAYVAADASLRLVITDGATDKLPPDVDIVALDELLIGSIVRPLPVVSGDDPAYVIYTSGTTGEPKGAAIPHRNLLSLIQATESVLGHGDKDVWTVFHSLAFDFSVWEIWGCLLTGGRLVMVPYWTARTPEAFARLLSDEGVTVLAQTPSAFANLVPAVLASGDLPALRTVVFGGEALRVRALVPWIRRMPLSACRLVNMYGITETTVHVTFHDISARDAVTNSRTVGRALPGWSVTVRDADGQLLPFGAAGEICVGGAGLATGYLGLPDLTRTRFPVDPRAGERYYRSGDLGRMRPDGTLDHLGRIDDQIKIRGYRVELGEIRAALLDHPALRDAVVAFRENDEGGELHAYVVATQEVSMVDLRRWLRAKLTDYMVPAYLRAVDALPLTHNGKADLEKLLALDDDRTEDAAVEAADAPVSPAAAVRMAWGNEFGRDSAADDFFDLGGTSLQALKIAAALNSMGLRTVDPRDIYLNPTVPELVSFLTVRRSAVDQVD